jgi:hypothetical protein
MPGKLMLLYGLGTATRRPDVLAWLVIVVSNLGALPMYQFVRDVFGDRRMAGIAAVLYLFVPAKLLFFPLMNTVTPVVTLIAACVLARWLATGKAAYAALLGATVYALVFFEPMPLAAGLLFGALMARTTALGGMSARLMATHVAVGSLAFAGAGLAMYASFGFDLLAIFRDVRADAVAFNVTAARPYGLWVWHNLREFAIGAGPCQIVLAGAALASGLRSTSRWRERLTEPITTVCLGLLAVVIAIDLIGINRGEVTRLWIFLACLIQIPAAYACARLDTRAATVVVVALSILQAALGTAMIGFIVLR